MRSKAAQEITDLRDLIRDLERAVSGLPLRVAKGGAGGGLGIDTVSVFPAIPLTGFRIIFYTPETPETGARQLWATASGETRWFPLYKFTTCEGEPGT